jgi:DNA-binding HxlR family transcriptional regulator
MNLEETKEPEFRDIIHFQEEGVMILRDPQMIQMVKDDNYYSVLWALREGPLSVKEILESYNQYVILKVEKMGLQGEERSNKITEMQRSEKTIYRYIKELVHAGLVAKAGQRVVLGKTITENLFSRTARVYLLEDTKEGWWKSDESRTILDRVSRILSFVKDIPPPSISTLAEIMDEIHSTRNFEIIRWLDDHYDDISKIFLEGSHKENEKTLYVLRTISLILSAEKYSARVKNCCEAN